MVLRPVVALVALAARLGAAVPQEPLADPPATAQDSRAGAPVPSLTGPLPVTGESHPFNVSTVALAPYGYVEEEFLVSGRANVYDYDAAGKAKLLRLYPNHGVYARAVIAQVDELVRDRWLTREDGAATINEAVGAPVPK